MDRHTMMLWAIIAMQLYSVTDEVRSLLDDGDASDHWQSLTTNAISVMCTLLTAVRAVTLRRIRRSLSRIELSIRTAAVDKHDNHADDAGANDDACDHRWSVRYRNRAWLTLVAVVFAYLKYGELKKFDGGGKNAYTTATTVLLGTVSTAGNYYVTVMFVDHVFLAKRVLYTLNVQITDTLGTGPSSFFTGFTMSDARLAYLKICNECATMTRAFQTQLFINIVDNVFRITLLMLSAFNTLMSNGTDTIMITLYFLYDSLIRTLQMYYIIDACHTTVEQANFINITFQKKINECSQIYFTKRKIHLFIMEMIDQKIEFTIYGFICLDFEMFVSIMGTITTYFLIMVQLGSSPNILEKSLNESTIISTKNTTVISIK